VNRAVGAYCWLYCLIYSDPEGPLIVYLTPTYLM